MKKLFTIIFCFSFFICNSQSLGKERVDKLNKTVVKIKISIDGSKDSLITNGTGFVFSKEGYIATNYHVIRPTISIDSLNNSAIPLNRLFAEFVDGRLIELGIHYKLLSIDKALKDAIFNDYCVLVPLEKNTTTEHLKLGNWNDLNNGDEIYSCGFPYGFEQNLFTKGIVSSKFNQELKIDKNSMGIDSIGFRNVAYLDLTVNKGNSGGPVLMFSKSENKDVVLGISTFTISPHANKMKNIESELKLIQHYFPNMSIGRLELYDGKVIENNLAKNLISITSAFQYLSVGIGGCTSIEYLKAFIQ